MTDTAGRPYPTEQAAMLGLEGPPPAFTFDGIEVTQVVQNMAHDVPLVAGKATAVRVYLSVASPGSTAIRGALAARSPAGQGAWRAVPSLGATVLDPGDNGSLRSKREDLSKSLNFLLPAELTAAGACELRLDSLELADGAQPLAVPAGAACIVTFMPAPVLRVAIVGIRYRGSTPGSTHEPRALDYALIRSWLQRAYPVAEVAWSQVAVDGPMPWPFMATNINAFLRGLRRNDLLAGVDRRTHYYGLIFDAGGANFMRGRASGIPAIANPATVASGPTGAADFGWDRDGSYGDWYTGHELGHTFGRFHAEFCNAQGGAPYPFPNGQLSHDDGSFAGFDIGDVALGAPMQALPGAAWHDLMTYCNNQWLSSFTYIGIYNRLLEEELLPASSAAPEGLEGLMAMTSSGVVHAVAVVNLTTATGHFQHVTAYPGTSLEAGIPELGATPPDAGPVVLALRLLNDAGEQIAEYPAGFIPDVCLDLGDDTTGIVDATIPNDPAAARLDLLLNGAVLDTFAAAAPALPATDIEVRDTGPAGLAAAEGSAPKSPVLTWTDPGRESLSGAPGVAALAEQAPTYTVAISVDGGQSWRTVGFGLTQPQVTIDSSLLLGAETVLVRVTTTNGFTSQSSVTTLNAAGML